MYNQVRSQFDNACRSDNIFLQNHSVATRNTVHSWRFSLIFLYFRFVLRSQVWRGFFLNKYIVPGALLVFGVVPGIPRPDLENLRYPQNSPSFLLPHAVPLHPLFRLPIAYNSVLHLEEYCPVCQKSQGKNVFEKKCVKVYGFLQVCEKNIS